MLLAEAGGVFVALLLYISGCWGKTNSICALKGSSVDLPCSLTHPTSGKTWYIGPREISVDGNRYNMSNESRSTLTINDLKESDAGRYFCRDSEWNWSSGILLHVTDLQVKVTPVTATEGQRVTLICSTSCPLTGSPNPTTYMWYKNEQFLYQDSSPWYQHPVSSEEAVTYSCAVQGYEHLRAPGVSVDSVTPTCFRVTYAEGRMCHFKQASVKEPCSITYPRELHVQMTPVTGYGQSVTLTCNTGCSLADTTSTYWFKNRNKYDDRHQISVPSSSDDIFYCAVLDHEDLHSPAVYVGDENYWSVNCVSRRICALEGSSVDISFVFSYSRSQQTKLQFWYIRITETTTGEGNTKYLKEEENRVTFHENMKNHHILRIKNLTESDSGEYTVRFRTTEFRYSSAPGVTLKVTALTVKVTPAVVTEGQRVTLTCSTSCPLTDNTTYIWYQNRRPLTRPESQHKHLVLDPVSSQHAGKYSCAVKEQIIISPEETLTVHRTWTLAAAAGIPAVLLTIITLSVLLWIRRKKTSTQPPGPATADTMEQLNSNSGPTYENISAVPRTSTPAAQSDAAEQGDLPYSSVHFFKHQKHSLYSTPRPPQRQEDVQYAAIKFN